MRHPRGSAAVVLLTLAVAACPAAPSPGHDERPTEAEPATPDGPEFVAAGPGDVAEVVRDAMDEAEADGRRLVVYVGAGWCEPCKHFHDAVESGELDPVFPDLRLIEFDLDDDQARLAEAGYASRLVPLFCRPDAKGRGTARRIEGSVKGDAAVANITPRLTALLEGN